MKKIISIVFIIIICFSLTGCFESKAEKQKRKEYFAQAEKNAIKYIENKYDFTPKIISKKCTFNNSDNFSSNCNETIQLIAKDKNKKTFTILINGSKETDEGSDNYEKDKIEKDIINELKEDFGEPYKYQIMYGNENENIISKKYDGNLDEVLEKANVKIILEYIDIDNLEDKQNILKTSEYLKKYNRVYILNYKSKKAYKKTKKHTYNITGSYLESEFENNKNNLKDVLVLDYSNIHYYNYE